MTGPNKTIRKQLKSLELHLQECLLLLDWPASGSHLLTAGGRINLFEYRQVIVGSLPICQAVDGGAFRYRDRCLGHERKMIGAETGVARAAPCQGAGVS